ncbi:MAG: hypothetical protein WCQ72_00450 [Eubacteriales bacterium]
MKPRGDPDGAIKAALDIYTGGSGSVSPDTARAAVSFALGLRA